jgi:hypothetical protein
MTTSARPARPVLMSDMDFALLRSMARNEIVASAWVMRHRQIPVIEGEGLARGSIRRAHNHQIPASPGHHVERHDDRVATPTGLYAIRINGRLGATALSAFPSMRSELRGSETVLTGVLEDRSALFGVVAQIEALGLELLELRQIRTASSSHRTDQPS